MIDTKLPVYGIFIIIALTVGLIIIWINLKKLKFTTEEKINLLMYISFGALIGGKLLEYITNLKKIDNLSKFKSIGVSSYGAVFGIIIILLLFSKKYKKKFIDLIYVSLPALPLMYAIAKLGCFLVGCCYGVKYSGPLKIVYNYSLFAPKNISLFPVQLLEALVFIIISIYAYQKVKNSSPNNGTIGKIIIVSSSMKFILDYLRMSHTTIITINQAISIMFFLAGIYFIMKNKNSENVQ